MRIVLAMMACAACARGHGSHAPDVAAKLPPWLEYRHVTKGLRIVGEIDQHVVPELRPLAGLGPIKRVVVGVDDGIANLVARLDANGMVRENDVDAHTTRVVPFTGPVADYAPTAGAWFTTPRHVAIVPDGIQIVGDGSRWRFPNPEGFTSTADSCFARELPSSEPLPCFGRLPRAGETTVLQQDSTIGPLSRVEWNALKTTSRFLLAGWELGGGPRDDAHVLQLAGAWGRKEGNSEDWHEAYRPALVCGVLADHTVACWGTSQFYELGDGVRSTAQRFAHVPGLANVVEVAVGSNYACARTTAGKVACWGDASQGAFPLPRHPDGVATPGCRVDEDATERAYRDLVERERERADACMQSSCPAGELDCHLGCGPNHFERTPVYRRDGACTLARVLGRPQVLDLTGVVSISAGHSTACFVYENGYSSCGGG